MGKWRLLATRNRHYRICLIVLHLLGSTPTSPEARGRRYERRKREIGNGFHAQTAPPSDSGPALLDSSHRRKRENGNGFHVAGSQGTPLQAIVCPHGYLSYFFNFLIVGSYNFNHICQNSFISILLWSKYFFEDTAMVIYTPSNYLSILFLQFSYSRVIQF